MECNIDRQHEEVISVVIPVYNEQENIEHLHSELNDVMQGLTENFEIIFVDDGSTDSSWDTIANLHGRDKNVKGIRFSRNYGHQRALFAGLSHAQGDAVISMDADLQHPPQTIPVLVEEWKKGYKVVNTVRSQPKRLSLFKKATSALFYRLFSLLSGVAIRPGMADFRLLDRHVITSLKKFSEQTLFLRGIIQIVGFKSTQVHYQCRERYRGETKYTLRKMIKFAWTGISAFSLVPLRIAIFLGIFTSLVAFSELVYALCVKLFTDSAVPGWASAVSILSLLFGILFILIGIIGEYIGRILVEVRQRPRYLIQDQIGVDIPVGEMVAQQR